MKIIPLRDNVLVRRKEIPTSTTSGIFTGSQPDKQNIAFVLDIGEDVYNIDIGDEVLFTKIAGIDVKTDTETLLLLKVNDIVAIIEE